MTITATAQPKAILSNDELRQAIEDARVAISKTCTHEAHYKISIAHYEALLNEQERRARRAQPGLKEKC